LIEYVNVKLFMPFTSSLINLANWVHDQISMI